jgi:hypothetical protein
LHPLMTLKLPLAVGSNSSSMYPGLQPRNMQRRVSPYVGHFDQMYTARAVDAGDMLLNPSAASSQPQLRLLQVRPLVHAAVMQYLKGREALLSSVPK